MAVYRYINNSDEPVVAGAHTVPPWGEVILNDPTDELNFKVGTYLECIKDGELMDSSMLPILDYVELIPAPSVDLELHIKPEVSPESVVTPEVEVDTETPEVIAEIVKED